MHILIDIALTAGYICSHDTRRKTQKAAEEEQTIDEPGSAYFGTRAGPSGRDYPGLSLPPGIRQREQPEPDEAHDLVQHIHGRAERAACKGQSEKTSKDPIAIPRGNPLLRSPLMRLVTAGAVLA